MVVVSLDWSTRSQSGDRRQRIGVRCSDHAQPVLVNERSRCWIIELKDCQNINRIDKEEQGERGVAWAKWNWWDAETPNFKFARFSAAELSHRGECFISAYCKSLRSAATQSASIIACNGIVRYKIVLVVTVSGLQHPVYLGKSSKPSSLHLIYVRLLDKVFHGNYILSISIIALDGNYQRDMDEIAESLDNRQPYMPAKKSKADIIERYM